MWLLAEALCNNSAQSTDSQVPAPVNADVGNQLLACNTANHEEQSISSNLMPSSVSEHDTGSDYYAQLLNQTKVKTVSQYVQQEMEEQLKKVRLLLC